MAVLYRHSGETKRIRTGEEEGKRDRLSLLIKFTPRVLLHHTSCKIPKSSHEGIWIQLCVCYVGTRRKINHCFFFAVNEASQVQKQTSNIKEL